MALLTLDTVWLNAKDPAGGWTDGIELGSASSLSQSESSAMRVRATTGGRSAVTILPGGTQTWQVSCNLAVAGEVAWLRDHRKLLVCVRDMHGRRIFGAYPEVTVAPLTDGEHFQVSATVTQVDYDGQG